MALEWLKEILGEAYTDEVDGKVAEKLDELYVTKESSDQQIAQLNEAHGKEVAGLKIGAAVDAALTKAGARNQTAVKALLDMEQIKLDKEGNITGIDEQVKSLLKGKDTGFLFASEQQPVLSGVTPAKVSQPNEPSGWVESSQGSGLNPIFKTI